MPEQPKPDRERRRGSGRLISDRYRAELESETDDRRKGLHDAARSSRSGLRKPVSPLVFTVVIAATVATALVVWLTSGTPKRLTPPPMDPDQEASLGVAGLWASAALDHARQNEGGLPPGSSSAADHFANTSADHAGVDLDASPYDSEQTMDRDFVYFPVVSSYGALGGIDPGQLITVVDRAALESGYLHAAFLDGSARRIPRSEAEALLAIEQNGWLIDQLGLDLSLLSE